MVRKPLLATVFLVVLSMGSAYVLGDAEEEGMAREKRAGECMDSSRMCPTWAKFFCQGRFADYMRQNCPKSCKFCTESPTQCVDEASYASRCPKWAMYYCTSHKGFMTKNCPKSCKFCTAECSDKAQYAARCPGWAARYCNDPRFETFMTKNCAKTCNKCGGEAGSTTVEASATTAVASGGCRCGVKKTRKIVGGSETEVNEYPWTAIFADANGLRQGGCAATLVASNWAVTASHCLIDSNGPIRTTGDLSLVLGVHDRTVTTDALRKVVRLAEIITHPQYNDFTSQNDIALLKLAESVDLNVYSPACLPAQGTDFTGQKGWVYGWGVTQEGGNNLATKLRDVEIPIVSDSVCRAAMEPQGVTITEDMLCAGGMAGKDGCQGDSGGPFTVDVEGKHTLAGDVSFGIGCARDGLYGVYGETAFFRNWIDETIEARGGATFCE